MKVARAHAEASKNQAYEEAKAQEAARKGEWDDACNSNFPQSCAVIAPVWDIF